MTRSLNKLTTLRSLSIGFSAAVLALACGAEDKNNPEPKVVEIPRADPCENPLNVECTKTNPTPPPPPDTKAPDAKPPEPPSQEELDKAIAENVLAANCGYCHGPNLTKESAKAGMNFIDDIDQLVTAGKIDPLSSVTSRVIIRMQRGEMPPPGSGYPPVSEADIDKVVSYIDNPRYWEGVPDTNCVDEEQLVDFDDLYQAVNQDLAQVDNEDQVFTRYISLTNRFTAGVCADALDRERQAMTKMLNMLSIRAKVEKPTSVNKENTLYRIDLRDFEWNRSITVDGTAFDDVWEAIADANDYAIEFFGDDADEAKEDTATAFPVMFADQLQDVAIIGNLYYAIIDVDVTQTLGTFISEKLLIDVVADIEEEEAIRAGTTKSIISRQDRLVERHDIVVRGGAFWQSFDFDANDANDSIFQDPFGFTAGGSEAIFTLPNGMLGFIIADADDNIVEDSNILLDSNQNNFRALTSVSCSNCHGPGFIPVVDEVGPLARDNARAFDLDREEVEALEALYVSKEVFAAQIKSDTEGFYQRALQLADLPVQGGDPVSRVFQRFDADVTLRDAAGDLGLLPADLEDNLRLLNPVLAVLNPGSVNRQGGTIDRDDFTAVYLESVCALTTTLENAPDPVVCDQFE